MRKITTKSSEAKRKKRNQIIIGVVLVFVIFGSVFGVIVNSFGKDKNSSKKINYNGLEFLEQNGFWFTDTEGMNFVFKYSPEQTKDILFYKNLEDYYDQTLYISSESDEASTEIYRNMNEIVQRMQSACLGRLNNLTNETSIEGECDESLPVKTCDNNIIIIREGNFSDIREEDNCVFVEGEKENLTMITDEFLYRLFKIKV